MESTTVRQLLRSICLDLQWEYAVFWRFKHQNSMFLAWEDGYCDYPNTRASAESKSRNIGFGQEAWIASSSSSCCDISIDSRSGDGYTVGAAVASMACLMYSLGEGTVGRVASTENHCWVFSDEFNENLLPEFPEEWQLQFAVGIKTILLVPVAPLGVVQLGSLEKVRKDMKVVADIKNMFNTLHLVTDTCIPSILSKELQGQSTFSPRSHVKKFEPSDGITDFRNPIPSAVMVKRDHTINYVQKSKDSLSIVIPDIRSQLTEQDSLLIHANNAGMSGTEAGDLSPDSSTVSFSQSQSSYVSHLQLSDISNFLLQEEVSVSSPSNLTSLGFDFDTDMIINLWSSNELIDLPFGEEIYNDYESECGLLTFPADYELTSDFGPPIEGWCNEYVTKASIVGEDVCSVSSLICHTNYIGGFESPIRKFNGFSNELISQEDLLDAVVASAVTISSGTASGRLNSVRSSTTSCGLLSPCQTQSQPQPDHLVGDLGQWGYGMTAFADEQKVPESCVSEYSSKSVVTVQVDEMQKKRIQSKRGSKQSAIGKRKSKVADIQKQRPRDRQMIQDRVRELRELVPNGAKCSIDSLLDRTAKHMHYLRNATSQAKKVKQHVNRKVIGRKDSRSSETPSHHNGRDWSVCPVIIEDLDHPQHMLIEVLCEDHKLFLEIAQVLRDSGLTILKGVTEARSNKILAHFVVEVSTGFNRMDIFWPLMNLLKLCNPVPTIF
ncbi:hypothetical protein MKX01_001970 [Papaver californicum]|nr:hypothetical protein MKX01_001970 [Papaver californicum]